MKSTIIAGIAGLMLVGCSDTTKTERAWSFFPNMHEQESLRAYEPSISPGEKVRSGRSMRTPIEGTVPTTYSKYKLAKGSAASNETANPLPNDMEVLKTGRRAYNIYCIVCHGERGEGDGNIIPSLNDSTTLNSGHTAKSTNHFPPQPINTVRVQKMTDGYLFNYITHGGAVMPKYGHLPVEMRWSIVRYLRVLFKANNATDEEYKYFQENIETLKDPAARDIVHDWRSK